MSRFRVLITAGLLGALVPLTGATAAVEPDHDLGTLAPKESATWTGEALTGTNYNYHGGFLAEAPREVFGTPDTCTKDPNTTCSTAVVEFSNPLAEDNPKTSTTRQARVRIDADKVSDLDLAAYALNADGTKGARLSATGTGGCPCPPDNPLGLWEEVTFSVRTTKTQPTVKVLIEVVYFAAAAAGYQGQVTF